MAEAREIFDDAMLSVEATVNKGDCRGRGSSELLGQMKICILDSAFRPDGNTVYPYVHPLEAANPGWRSSEHFAARPEKPTWPSGGLIVAAHRPGRELGDFPLFASPGVLAMSARARDVLSSFLEPCGEILPLRMIDGPDLYLFNPLPYYDCLDPARSLGPRGRDGSLLRITRYEFVRESIPDVPVFRSKNSWRTLFSIEHRDDGQAGLQDVVERHGLKGLTFREVWNDVQHGLPLEQQRIE